MTNTSESKIKKAYEELLERFVKWAETCVDIRAVIVIGSRARVDYVADEWADLDIVVITTNPNRYVSTADWTNNIGKPLLTFIEPTSTGNEKERRVLFEGMLDVDFAIISEEEARRLLQAGTNPQVAIQISNLVGRGVRVLIDKDGVISQLLAFIAHTKKLPPCRPTQHDFLEVVNDFLYHAVFTTKHLKRGELWWTVTCLNCYMQHLLLRMMEWHALATHDWNYDTWFRGRFLEEWAHPEAMKELHKTFAHYDKEDVKHALLAAVDLFRWLATETAKKLGYPYLTKEDKHVTKWIQTCLQK